MSTWVRIRSWHWIAGYTRGGGVQTRCGLYVPPGRFRPDKDVSESLPLGEKSCETCTRLVLHDEESH